MKPPIIEKNTNQEIRPDEIRLLSEVNGVSRKTVIERIEMGDWVLNEEGEWADLCEEPCNDR